MQILLVISGVALRNKEALVPHVLWVLQLSKMIPIKHHHLLAVCRVTVHLPVYFTLHIGPNRVYTPTVGRVHSPTLAGSRVTVNPALLKILLVDRAL